MTEGVTVTVSVWAEFGSVMEIWRNGWLASASMPETEALPPLEIDGGRMPVLVTETRVPPYTLPDRVVKVSPR